MDKEVKQKWVDALRSGKYKQGQGYLRTPDGYCCLGVLCEVLNAEYTYSDIHLPREVAVQVGLASISPKVTWDGSNVSLEDLNDGSEDKKIEPQDFNKIADIIEEQL